MSGAVNDLKVRIGGEIKGLQDALSKANDKLSQFADYAAIAGKGLASIAVIGGLGKVAAQIGEIALAAGRQAEELTQASQITGMTTSTLQDYDVMLNRVGLSQNDLQIGLRTLSKKIEDARTGAGNAADRFRQMGIDLNKLSTTEEVLAAIAEKSSKMAGGMEKGAAMVDLLGRMGQRLIPAFEGGAQAIEEARKKSEDMQKLSGIQIAKLNTMDDAVDDLNKSWERLGQQFGAFVAPSITMVADALQWLVSLGARLFKEMDTAADTLAIRFTHLALAVNEAAAVLFSTDVFSGDAWKKALSNIDMIDKEAAKLIAKRRELANAPEAKDTRANPAALINSEKLLAAQRAAADAEIRITETTAKAIEARWKAWNDVIRADWDRAKQDFILNAVDIAEAAQAMSESVTEYTRTSAIAQIQAYNEWAKKRLAIEQDGSKEKEALEGQVTQKLIEMWGQVVANDIAGDAERIRSAVAVAAARQDAAIKEAEAGLARFQLYQQMTEREKQLDVDRANSNLAVVQAQEGALEQQFQDHRRILDATMAAINAEEAKEIASAQITEEQKVAIREKYRAQRLQAENQFIQSMRQVANSELSDAAKVADAKFNLLKAQQDQEFALFRDTDALRQAKQAALTAQYQADLVAAQDNASQRLAIEANYVAQSMALAQQIPTFWQQQLQLIQQSAVFTWSTITMSFASSMAGVIQGTMTMQQFFQQAMNTILTSAINLVIQLAAQWAAATLFKSKEDDKQAGSHFAMEMAKTKITAVQEAARVAVVKLSQQAMAASTLTYLAAIMGVGNAALAVAVAVMETIVAVMYAAAKAAAIIPGGQPIAGDLTAAATTLQFLGGAAITAGFEAIQTAGGAAIVAMSSALPALAEGGIVTGPTVALIGEAGPEAVVPLSRGDAYMGGGYLGITVELESEPILRMLMPKMVGEIRLRAGAIA